MPMPFLHQISKESWFLARHHTTSNVSTKALFSLLSGLYDLFGRQNFGVRPDAHVPWLYSFLGKKYESFLVTASLLPGTFRPPLSRTAVSRRFTVMRIWG